MGEVISGVDLPLIVGAVVWCEQYTISDKIPHHCVARLKILLHAQDRLARFVETVPHLLELGKGLRYGSRAMHTSLSRSTLVTSTVRIDLLG